MNSSQMERLIKYIQELRGSLTHEEFAERLGVARSTVSYWESGFGCPSPRNIEKLAALKGWLPEELKNYLETGELPSPNPLKSLELLVRRKGWSLCDLKAYLEKVDLSSLEKADFHSQESVQVLENKIRSLPVEQVARLSFVCSETLAQKLSVKKAG